MPLLSNRKEFDKAAMQQVEIDFLHDVLATAKESPNALIIHSSNWEKLCGALLAAKRLTKDKNPYNKRGAWRIVWAIERRKKQLRREN